MNRLLLLLGLTAIAALAVGPALVDSKTRAPAVVQFVGWQDLHFDHPEDNTGKVCGSVDLTAGRWRISYRAMVYSSRPPEDTGTVSAFATLDFPTTGVEGSPLDPDALFTTGGSVGGNSYRAIWTLSTVQVVRLPHPEHVDLVIWQSEGGNWDSLQCLGERSRTIIRAERVG